MTGGPSQVAYKECSGHVTPTTSSLQSGLGSLRASWTSLVVQTVKCLPAMRETWVPSLGREDLLEKEMATHSSTLAWKTPWMEEPGRLQSMRLQRVRHD